jgi:predicted Zn-dependent protease
MAVARPRCSWSWPSAFALATVLACLSVYAAAGQGPGVHDERIAGNRAEQFSWALSRNPSFAYELLDPRLRAQMPPGDFLAAASKMFNSADPAALRATRFAAVPGQRALDVFLIAPPGGRHFRFRMTGSAADGYRIANFAAVDVPDAGARPLRADTGPYDLYAATSRNPTIAFVPIAADVALVTALAETFRARLQLDTSVQAGHVPSARARSAERGQLIGEVLAKEIEPRCRAKGMAGTPYVIGVTGEDMSLQTQAAWRFAFSYRLRPCVAVVSYARMGVGAPPDSGVLTARLRKMVAKNLGVLVYGLPQSKDPRSVMFDDILGVDELDFIEENFDRAGMAARHLW